MLEPIEECKRLKCIHLTTTFNDIPYCNEQQRILSKFTTCRRFEVEENRREYFPVYKFLGGGGR